MPRASADGATYPSRIKNVMSKVLSVEITVTDSVLMDRPRPQPRNARHSAKTLASPSFAPTVARMLTSKRDGGSGRASSASDSVVVEGSSSRSSTPDAAGVLLSTAAMPRYRYTREELLALMNSPLSKIKPEICSSLHKLFDIGCREAESSALDEQAYMRQAMAIKKHLNIGGESQSFVSQVNVDNEGDQRIVLVPRRLSFSTGCHVASSSGSVNSPELKRERNRRDGHRIGSGRIHISDKHLERELHDHRAVCNRDQDYEDRCYERGGGGPGGIKVLKRDYEGRHQEGGRGRRYIGGSRSGREDPEWFTDGPASQADKLELWDLDQGHGSRSFPKDVRGIDASKVKLAAKQSMEADGTETVAKEQGRNEIVDVCSGVVDESGEKSRRVRLAEENSPLESMSSSNQLRHDGKKDPNPGTQHMRSSSSPATMSPLQNTDAELDFNAIFNIESIPGLSEMFGLEPEQSKSGSSRFKQWFHFGSHGNSRCGDSRRSSLTDEFGYINDIICGRSSPLGTLSPPLQQSVHSPGLYSADKCSSDTQNLLELLQRAHIDAVGADGRPVVAARNGSTVRSSQIQLPVIPADTGSSFNHSLQNSADSKIDAKAVETGLKVILGGSVFGDSMLSSLPSVTHLGSLITGPPSGAKVLLAEELEAQLVAYSSDRSEISHAATASSVSRPSNCRTSADNSLTPPRLAPWSGSNPGNLSFCSLPVLPTGTKVTLLSELEAGLGGLCAADRAAVNCQLPDGSADGSLSVLTAAGRPVMSHPPAMLTVNTFNSRMTDLAAYKKLLGLVMDPFGGQTANETTLPIVTSPTSASMNSLEANQPSNSLANNQRDFIQRYLLQQQQLKMLNRSQHPHPEGMVIASSGGGGIPPHILPADIPHPLYMTPGSFVDRAPPGEAVAPSGKASDVPSLFEPSVFGHPSAGMLNLHVEDDLSMLPGGVSSKFGGHQFAIGSHPLTINNGQVYQSPERAGEGLPPDSLLLQCLGSAGGKLQPGYTKHLLQHPPTSHAVPSHGAALHHGQHQQVAAKMVHLAVHDKFANPAKPGMTRPVDQSPIPPPHLTLQPPFGHPQAAAAVTTLSSHGIPILAPQTLLQQPPQSPRRAPSPLMFGSQPPMNLTAPLPVHLGPMTPILSPTLSPNTLQVAQPGSNLSSPVMRVPSPQELSGLAQSILQNALIKKQLEEQKERFIKRQQERNKSPKVQSSLPIAAMAASNSKASSMTSASMTAVDSSVLEAGKTLPSSFLPTSVLRKMVNTKMEEKLASQCGDVEKSVPLLKVVKPDEEEGAEDGDEKDSKENQNIPARSSEGQNGAARPITDDHCGPTEDSPPTNPARQPDVMSSTDPGKQLPLTSAGGPPDEAGLRPSAARRLVGQGLMNLSSLADVPAHQTIVDPVTGSLPFPVVTSFVPSGRQIKGKKLPENLPVSLAPASGNVKNRVGHLPRDMRQLQQQQQQQPHQTHFQMTSSANCRGGGGVGAPINTLHALEMAKILEQQNMGLVSPVPVLPTAPPPPPSLVTQFVPSLSAENSTFGVKQLPRMVVHPPFGVNSSTSNALLLQRLGRSNLQRAALSSMGHLNLNQLALIQAIQLQAQQQQQQQMWNRSHIRPISSSSGRPICPPGFLPPNQLPTNLGSRPSAANAATSNANGIDRQNGPEIVGRKIPFVGTNSGHKSDGDSTGRHQIVETTSTSGVDDPRYDMLVDGGSQLAVASVGSRQSEAHHRLQMVQNDHAMDGNLARWFGSDVFHQSMPPPLAPVGQKVLTVDEIECWQHAVSKS